MADVAPLKKPNWFSRLAHPGEFLRWSTGWITPLAVITALLFAVAFYLIIFVAPRETENVGTTLPILFMHVPNAWLSQMVYGVMAIAAFGTLIWRHPLADVANKAAAPLGAVFTALALFTGSLWGRPTWGTFWEWDGRMTSTLVLFLIYLGIMALWRAYDDQLKAGRIAAIVTLVGAVNIPIIKFSVDWWETLHQPSSVIVAGGPRMAATVLWPLLTITLAFTFLFLVLHIVSIRTEILRRRAETLSRQAAATGDA